MTLAELQVLAKKPLTKVEHGIVAGAAKRLRAGQEVTKKQAAAIDGIRRKVAEQEGGSIGRQLPVEQRNFKDALCPDCGVMLPWPSGYLRHYWMEHRSVPGVQWAFDKILRDRKEYDERQASGAAQV